MEHSPVIQSNPQMSTRWARRRCLIAGLVGMSVSGLLFVFWSYLDPVLGLRLLTERFRYGIDQFGVRDIQFCVPATPHTAAIREKVLAGISRLQAPLGPPVFRGRVLLEFSRGASMGQVQPRRTVFGRVVSFPSANAMLGADEQVWTHELIHVLYTPDEAFAHLPHLVIEGITEDLTRECLQLEDFPLNQRLEQYYLQSLSGFLDPDDELDALPAVVRALSYRFGRIFFAQLRDLDTLLVSGLLRNPPAKRLGWVTFCQWLLIRTTKTDAIREFINHTALFSPLRQPVYVIPVMEQHGVVTIHLFAESLDNHLVDVTTTASSPTTREQRQTRLLLAKGYGRIDLLWRHPMLPTKIEVHMQSSTQQYHQLINL